MFHFQATCNFTVAIELVSKNGILKNTFDKQCGLNDGCLPSMPKSRPLDKWSTLYFAVETKIVHEKVFVFKSVVVLCYNGLFENIEVVLEDIGDLTTLDWTLKLPNSSATLKPSFYSPLDVVFLSGIYFNSTTVSPDETMRAIQNRMVNTGHLGVDKTRSIPSWANGLTINEIQEPLHAAVQYIIFNFIFTDVREDMLKFTQANINHITEMHFCNQILLQREEFELLYNNQILYYKSTSEYLYRGQFVVNVDEFTIDVVGALVCVENTRFAQLASKGEKHSVFVVVIWGVLFSVCAQF